MDPALPIFWFHLHIHYTIDLIGIVAVAQE